MFINPFALSQGERVTPAWRTDVPAGGSALVGPFDLAGSGVSGPRS